MAVGSGTHSPRPFSRVHSFGIHKAGTWLHQGTDWKRPVRFTILYDILDKKQKKKEDMSVSESDAMSEEIEESEVEELTSDSDDGSTDVEKPSK